jgi:hypothetical protein
MRQNHNGWEHMAEQSFLLYGSQEVEGGKGLPRQGNIPQMQRINAGAYLLPPDRPHLLKFHHLLK